MKCPYTTYNFECLTKDYCDKCSMNPNVYLRDDCFQKAEFNYECPNCKGKFNQPGIDFNSSIYGSKRCPFCGMEMEGLNK